MTVAAMERFKAFVASPADNSVLSADIRSAVLSIAMQSEGSDALFEQLSAAHDAVSDGAVRNHIYAAMGDAPTAPLKKKSLDWALSGRVRSQDLIYTPMSMATSGKEGADLVFAWMQQEYNQIYERLGKTSMILFQHMVRVSGAGFVTTEKASELEVFWKSKDSYKMVAKTLSQTVEAIHSNAKFVKRLQESEAAKAAAWQRSSPSKL